MKVLLIAPFFFERHRWMISAWKTAHELAKDHDVVVLTTGKPRHEKLGEHLTVHRLADIFLPDPVNYSIVPNLFPRLFFLVRREKPDVVIVNKAMFFTSLSVILLRLMHQKVILAVDTFPGINWFPRKRFVSFIMRIYAWCIGVPLMKLSHRVVLYHEGLIAIAKRLHLNWTVIHNGVDTEKFDSAVPAADIPHDEGRVNIGYVGRLESIKGYEDIVAAVERVTGDNPNVHAYLVGNIDDKGSYVLEHANAQIHFLGHRDDIASIFKSLDIFLLASYSEGLPNALMEAMYCGCACISSDVGGVKILVRDGLTGMTFQPGDRRELEHKIRGLVASPDKRHELGMNARKRIEKDFSWEGIRPAYLELFDQMHITQR